MSSTTASSADDIGPDRLRCLVELCVGTPQRLGARRAGSSPGTCGQARSAEICRVLPRAGRGELSLLEFARRQAAGVHRPDRLRRPAGAERRSRELQGRPRQGEGGGGVYHFGGTGKLRAAAEPVLVIERFDPHRRELLVLLDAWLGIGHVPGVRQAGVVELQDEPRLDDRLVFFAHCLAEGMEELLLRCADCPRTGSAITSAGAAGTGRTPPTCRSPISSTCYCRCTQAPFRSRPAMFVMRMSGGSGRTSNCPTAR